MTPGKYLHGAVVHSVTGPLTNVREHCGQFSSGLISNGDFANFWKHFTI